jgi:uncharacterized protein YdaU (DUF1376 family)
MHYYKFNIADWHLATSHLSLEEEAVYFKLINFYYDTEQPIPLETQSVIRRLRLGSHKETVRLVLQEFFVLQENGWHHLRCDDEIQKYHHKAEVNQKVGKLGGRPKKINDLRNNPEITQTVSTNNPQITLTTNHKPLTSIGVAKATKGTRFDLVAIPEEWALFCKKERSDLNPTVVFDGFKDYWVSVAGAKGVKLDWTATWRNWIRNQKAGVSVVKPKQAWE